MVQVRTLASRCVLHSQFSPETFTDACMEICAGKTMGAVEAAFTQVMEKPDDYPVSPKAIASALANPKISKSGRHPADVAQSWFKKNRKALPRPKISPETRAAMAKKMKALADDLAIKGKNVEARGKPKRSIFSQSDPTITQRMERLHGITPSQEALESLKNKD